MHWTSTRLAPALATLGLCFACTSALAQTTTPVTGSLVTLVTEANNYNRLERLGAIANQDTYNRLTQVVGGVQPPCTATQLAPTASCPAALFRVLENVRELVQTANELLGGGAGRPTQFSLGLDAEGLGFALRWTTAEELTAVNSASGEFAQTQIASVLSRITALRFGASGFSVAGVPMPLDANRLTAATDGASSGTAGIDSENIASSWGGFLNGSFGWGDRKPTDLEDAFAFDGKELTLGLDYRFSRRFVLGVVGGYTRQRIDFDSSQSVVDGGIESDGYSASIFALNEWDGPYVSAAVSWQSLSIDSTRVINYPSFNINTDPVYATSYGSTKSNTLSATLSLGWPVALRAFSFEPYLRGDYSSNAIDAFKERSVDNLNGLQPAGFDFAFGKQTIKSFDTVLGLRAQYALTPSFGVVVPYITGEFHHNLDDKVDVTQATYNGASANPAVFEIPEDKPDVNFITLAAGASVVLPHGIQGFLQYRTVQGLKSVSNQSISVGIRAEF